jgi:GNAT superfamily N-acetyltransferase
MPSRAVPARRETAPQGRGVGFHRFFLAVLIAFPRIRWAGVTLGFDEREVFTIAQRVIGCNLDESTLREQAMTLWQDGDYEISTDKMRLDVTAIHAFLVDAYCSKGRPMDQVGRSIEHSLCFGLYHQQEQIGFARVVSDFTTFAYIADVYVIDSYRGRGLGKRLMGCIMEYEELHGLKRWILATADAHGFYTHFGFTSLASPERLMEKLVSPS